MSYEYLMDAHTQYLGCTRICLNGQILFLPPSDTGNFFLNEIVEECIRVQLDQLPEARIDDEGRFFTLQPVFARTTPAKHIHSELTPIPTLLTIMHNAGYTISTNYWTKNRDKLKRTKRSL
ncbi:MAG: hypothetical protein AABX70_00610 [Nanoarchaeota archaeon]